MSNRGRPRGLDYRTPRSAAFARVLENVVFEPSGCIRWIGCLNDSGYGVMRIRGRLERVHRLMYEDFRGPIPDGLVLDHQCDNRPCVHPEHTVPTTSGQNVARSLTGRKRV